MKKILVFAVLIVHSLASPLIFGEDGFIQKAAQKVAQDIHNARVKVQQDLLILEGKVHNTVVKILKGGETETDDKEDVVTEQVELKKEHVVDSGNQNGKGEYNSGSSNDDVDGSTEHFRVVYNNGQGSLIPVREASNTHSNIGNRRHGTYENDTNKLNRYPESGEVANVDKYLLDKQDRRTANFQNGRRVGQIYNAPRDGGAVRNDLIDIVAFLIGYTSIFPLGSYSRPEEIRGHKNVLQINGQAADDGSTIEENVHHNKHVQSKILIKEDVHEKRENFLENLIHHKDTIEDVRHLEEFSHENTDVIKHSIDNHKPEDVHKKHENVIKKIVHKTGEAIEHTGEAIYDGAKKLVNKTEESIDKIAKTIHDDSIKLAQDTGEVIKKAEEEVEKTAKEVVEKGKKIIKGEEPITDLKVNSKIKVLNNEVKVEGELRIGFGHQTGAHGSVSVNILEQKAHINADILNSPALDDLPTQH